MGRMINPRLARSQIMGGILFGFGMALMEGTVPDETTGSFLSVMITMCSVLLTRETGRRHISTTGLHSSALSIIKLAQIRMVGRSFGASS